MTRLRVLLARLRGLFATGRLERELADEIESHLALSVEENVKRGMDPDEARRAALRAFGGVEQAKEAYRDRRGLPGIETLLQDLRYALRILGRSPGFAATAALSIAIGIGATSTIFSLINAVLLRTLPVKHPEQLVLFSTFGSSGSDYSFSYPHFEQLRGGVTALSSLIASGGTQRMRMVVAGSQGAGTPESVQGEKVSGNFFSALAEDAELGRTLTDADDKDGAPPVAVISHGLQLASFFSAAALVLAALGLYGVMSYGVARRTAEIGLRMALGARRRDVLWLVLREALALAIVGIAIGLPAGLLGTRAISSLLFGLSPSDPVTLTLATAALLAVAACAGYLPARRAARVGPADRPALRVGRAGCLLGRRRGRRRLVGLRLRASGVGVVPAHSAGRGRRARAPRHSRP